MTDMRKNVFPSLKWKYMLEILILALALLAFGKVTKQF